MERAFTLIELLVVMIIIAILMAVAIPTFLSQKSSASKTKALENIKFIIDAVESCGVTYQGDYTFCTEHAELVQIEPTLKDIGDVWGGGPRSPGEFDVDGIDNGRVVKAPVRGRGYQGFIVTTWIKDGNKNVWFSEAHMEDGAIIKGCGEGMTDQGAPSGGVPNPGAAVAGSRMCTKGTWG